MNLKYGYILIIAAAAVSVGRGYAQVPTDTLDVNRRTQLHQAAVNGIGGFAYDNSPATALFRYDFSLSSVKASFDYRKEDRAFLLAEGDGISAGRLNATSYLRLNEKSTVFGGAEYINGRKKNVVWNTTADYELLYPFIVADSIGGNLDIEQYRFNGGYAWRMGRINCGVSGDYRALHEYRKLDPRPRNRAAELTGNISAGYLFSCYTLTGTFGVTIYKQFQTVAYYNTVGYNTAQLRLLGLGNFYARFSGTDDSRSMNTNYEGNTYTGALTLAPRNGNGLFMSVRFDDFSVDQLIPSENYVPITNLNVQRLSASAAYRSDSETSAWGVEASGEYELRQGIQRLIDNGANYENNVLMEFPVYRNHIHRAYLKGVVEWKRPALSWSLNPQVSYYSTSSDYYYPERDMKFSNYTAGLGAGIVWRHGRWLTDIHAAASYTSNIDKSINIPPSYPDGKQAELANFYEFEKKTLALEEYNFDRWTTNYTTVSARIGGQLEINPTLALFASARWDSRMFKGGLKDNLFAVSIGINF